MTDLDQDVRRWYERGWRYRNGPAVGGLDHGDSIGAPDAWYLGYLDAAAGRPKWSMGEGALPDHGDHAGPDTDCRLCDV